MALTAFCIFLGHPVDVYVGIVTVALLLQISLRSVSRVSRVSSVSSVSSAVCTSDDIFPSHEHDNYCKSDIDICRGVQVKAEVEVDVCEAEGGRVKKLRIHRLKHLRKIFSGSEN